MTFDKKCFIKPEDIQAVVFRCQKCKAATSIPIDQLAKADIQSLATKQCAHCQIETGFSFSTSEIEIFLQFNEKLAKLRDALKGRKIEYSFQIECDEKEA